MTEPGVDTAAVEDWLRRLKWALASIPSPEREDIVDEARAHIADRIEAGATIPDALAGFGEPEAYARGFVDEMELSGLLARPRLPGLLAAIARRAHQSLVALLAFFTVLILGGTGIGFVLVAVWEVFDPEHVGFWVGPDDFNFGVIDNPGAANELLGPWLIPVALVLAAICWLLVRMVLISAARAIRRRRP